MPRSAEEKFAYEFHSRARQQFVGWMRCCACRKRGPCDNHHVKSDGMGRKAEYIWIVPLCRYCHRRYHDAGKLSFLQWVMREWGGLLIGDELYDQWDDAAAAVEALWQDDSEGLAY